MKKIKLIVYDKVSEKDYTERFTELKSKLDNKFVYTNLLLTENCESENEIKSFHDKYTKKGYEGLIIRNKKGGYQESYRSKNLQKYKEFVDDEFEIVGYTDGTGIEKDLVIWTCKTKTGNTFQVRPKGTHDERRDLFINGQRYVGKYLTVVYQELTNDGIPRFPTTLHGGKADIRDYE
jgi:DNA ligase-1